MTYQNLDDDNDGVVDADVDNQSVSTEEVGITDQDTGTTWNQKIINGRLYVEAN